MKTNYRMRRGFTLVELLVVIVIIAALAGLTAPMVIRQRKKADQTEAVNNARQIGMALFEFETEYGSFPDEATSTAVHDATDTEKVSGTAANDRFRQMVRAGIAQSEPMFYAKAPYTKKPDGITSGAKALEKGEVGFGIITNADGTGMSAAGNPSRPIVMAPFTTALSGEQFDYDVYDGKAVVLKLDNSVTSIPILKTTSKVKINGKELFEKSEDSVWGTSVSPQMAYPISK
ncbi:MAG: prepilin-type N-terminal cleavage/methylation domain-containing protein [Luteolibacter sp.]|uniref:type II secretion system protein n=1 Tax=Luteolibacter sp. TaxID=1962973 RepID=UPI0032643AA1